jgi:hypothetical protein
MSKRPGTDRVGKDAGAVGPKEARQISTVHTVLYSMHMRYCITCPATSFRVSRAVARVGSGIGSIVSGGNVRFWQDLGNFETNTA